MKREAMLSVIWATPYMRKKPEGRIPNGAWRNRKQNLNLSKRFNYRLIDFFAYYLYNRTR